MNFLEMWYTAANSPHGACFEVTNPASVKQQLYQARMKSNDPALDDFTIVPSPINPSHLWIVKKANPPAKSPSNVVELKL